MSRITCTLSVLALLTLPGCDPADGLTDDDQLADDEISERDFNFDPDIDIDFDPNIDFDFDFNPNIPLFLPPVLNVSSLPYGQVWVDGIDSRIVVISSALNSNEVYAYQVDLDTNAIVASRRASARGGELLRGQYIPISYITGPSWVPVHPSSKTYLIQRAVSWTEFGGNLYLPPPKGPIKGDDFKLIASTQVIAKSLSFTP